MELLLILGALWLFGAYEKAEGEATAGEADALPETPGLLARGDSRMPYDRWMLVEGTREADGVTWQFMEATGTLETRRADDGWMIKASSPAMAWKSRIQMTFYKQPSEQGPRTPVLSKLVTVER